jgi:hypothetical protein
MPVMASFGVPTTTRHISALEEVLGELMVLVVGALLLMLAALAGPQRRVDGWSLAAILSGGLLGAVLGYSLFAALLERAGFSVTAGRYPTPGYSESFGIAGFGATLGLLLGAFAAAHLLRVLTRRALPRQGMDGDA